MSDFEPPRYALYYAPAPSSALWQRASALLGYDAARGQEIGTAALPGISGNALKMVTERPRRYGFHATLKQPIYLRDGLNEDDLRAALRRFCERETSFVGPNLTVGNLRGFLVLVPDGPCPSLNQLAGRVVAYFDAFRAPLTVADRERRLASPLTARMRRSLDSWGYPYVFADLAFHMTLTGPIEPLAKVDAADEAAAVSGDDLHKAIAAYLAPALREPLAIDRLSLFRQQGRDQRFVMIDQVAFGANIHANLGL